MLGVFVFRIGHGVHIVRKIGVQILHISVNGIDAAKETAEIGGFSQFVKFTEEQFVVQDLEPGIENVVNFREKIVLPDRGTQTAQLFQIVLKTDDLLVDLIVVVDEKCREHGPFVSEKSVSDRGKKAGVMVELYQRHLNAAELELAAAVCPVDPVSIAGWLAVIGVSAVRKVGANPLPQLRNGFFAFIADLWLEEVGK